MSASSPNMPISRPCLFDRGHRAMISAATDAKNFNLLLASTIALAAVVVTTNRLLWRRLYRLAKVASSSKAKSAPVLDSPCSEARGYWNCKDCLCQIRQHVEQ